MNRVGRTAPRNCFVIIAIALALPCGCFRQAAQQEQSAVYIDLNISGERALEETRRFLEVGRRDAGTVGAELAAAFIVKRLSELGLKPEIDEFNEQTIDGNPTFRNVTATIPGKGPGAVLLLSHYDTKPGMPAGFEGANDSGSSTGLLLEMARAIMALNDPPAINIMFGFLDGEECRRAYGPSDGLHGSRRMAGKICAEQPDFAANIRAVIVLDMVGDKDLTITLPRNSTPFLLAAVFEAAQAENARNRFRLYSGNILDDHAPFLNAGLPAVNIIDFEYGSAPGRNDYWHSGHDTFDKLAPESLECVGRVVWRVIHKMRQ